MTESGSRDRRWFTSRSGVALIAFLGVAGVSLVTEHRAHVLGILPYLLLLACPLIHLFHGRGRHGSGHDDHDSQSGAGGARS